MKKRRIIFETVSFTTSRHCLCVIPSCLLRGAGVGVGAGCFTGSEAVIVSAVPAVLALRLVSHWEQSESDRELPRVPSRTVHQPLLRIAATSP